MPAVDQIAWSLSMVNLAFLAVIGAVIKISCRVFAVLTGPARGTEVTRAVMQVLTVSWGGRHKTSGLSSLVPDHPCRIPSVGLCSVLRVNGEHVSVAFRLG